MRLVRLLRVHPHPRPIAVPGGNRRLGLTASTRASGSLYTTDAEVDLLLQGVEDAVAFFGVGR